MSTLGAGNLLPTLTAVNTSVTPLSLQLQAVGAAVGALNASLSSVMVAMGGVTDFSDSLGLALALDNSLLSTRSTLARAAQAAGGLPSLPAPLGSADAAWSALVAGPLPSTAASLQSTLAALSSVATGLVTNATTMTSEAWRGVLTTTLPRLTSLTTTASSLRSSLAPITSTAADVRTLATYAGGVEAVACGEPLSSAVRAAAGAVTTFSAASAAVVRLGILRRGLEALGPAQTTLPALTSGVRDAVTGLAPASQAFNASWSALAARGVDDLVRGAGALQELRAVYVDNIDGKVIGLMVTVSDATGAFVAAVQTFVLQVGSGARVPCGLQPV